MWTRYVEQQIEGPDQAKLLTDDTFTRLHMAEALHKLHQYHNKMFAGLHFLHHLGLQLPRLPLGKQFRELYSLCLTSSHLCDSEGYKEALTLLRMMSLDDLCPLLEGKKSISEHRKLFCNKLCHLSLWNRNREDSGSFFFPPFDKNFIFMILYC